MQFKYISFKLLNNIFSWFATRNAGALLRVFRNNVDSGRQSFHFDFTDPSTHLGDRLFFFPLIIHLIKNGQMVSVSNQDFLTISLMERLFGITVPTGTANAFDTVVYPRPSFLNFMGLYRKVAIVDFTDTRARNHVSRQLIESFCRLFSLDLDPQIMGVDSLSSNYKQINSQDRYFLFSNYINSGIFRKRFVDESKLIKQALALKNQGYKIVLVGSKSDADIDRIKYPFVDVDLRGKTTVSDMVDLVRSPNVYGAVTYDNFLMHLIGICNKKAFVLFRGRFLKKNVDHHLKYVNNTFFQSEDNIVYL